MMMQTQKKDVRFTLDGTTPTATKGFLIVADDAPLTIPVKQAQVVKVIETAKAAVFDYCFGA